MGPLECDLPSFAPAFPNTFQWALCLMDVLPGYTVRRPIWSTVTHIHQRWPVELLTSTGVFISFPANKRKQWHHNSSPSPACSLWICMAVSCQTMSGGDLWRATAMLNMISIKPRRYPEICVETAVDPVSLSHLPLGILISSTLVDKRWRREG